jgi:hypothetical protein
MWTGWNTFAALFTSHKILDMRTTRVDGTEVLQIPIKLAVLVSNFVWGEVFGCSAIRRPNCLICAYSNAEMYGADDETTL